MNNVRAAILDIAIPLKSKTANDIVHDHFLLLGIKKEHCYFIKSTCYASCLDCLAIMLACLNGHCRRNQCNIAFLRQISRDFSALT